MKTKQQHEAKYARTADAGATVLGISVRRFYEKSKRPGFPRKTAKGWRVADLLAWAESNPGRNWSSLGADGERLHAERVRLQAELLELKERIAAGTVVHVPAWRDIITGMAARMKWTAQQAFERTAMDARDPRALADAQERFRSFCTALCRAMDQEEGP